MQTGRQAKGSPSRHSSQPAPRPSLRAAGHASSSLQKPKINPKIFSRRPYFKISPSYSSTTFLLALNKTDNNVIHNTALSPHHSLSSCCCDVKTVVSDAALALCFVTLGFFPSAAVQWSIITPKGQIVQSAFTGKGISSVSLIKTRSIRRWTFSFQVLQTLFPATPVSAKLNNKLSRQNY